MYGDANAADSVMASSKKKLILDGATLSPRLKPKGFDPSAIPLPIGKATREDGTAVARAYKHAAGKSNTYAPQVVDMIYYMAREGHLSDEQVGEFVRAKLASERDCPHPPAPVTWDQLVFLSANLTRLVIDPYREPCNSRVQIGPECPRPLILEWPIVFGGIDFARLPKPALRAMAHAAAKAFCAVCVEPIGPVDLQIEVPRILMLDTTNPVPDLTNISAVEISAPRASQLNRTSVTGVMQEVRRITQSTIPVGIAAPAFNAATVVDQTIELRPDFYTCDGQWVQQTRPFGVAPEVMGAPALRVLADTVERLRHYRREELISVIYRGGIRGGADTAKALCLGAAAVSLGLSAVVAMGNKITKIDGEESLINQLSLPINVQDATERIYNFAKSVNIEVTMLARACGKSSVTNMEPEDLRALTIAVSADTGVPLTGKDINFRSDLP